MAGTNLNIVPYDYALELKKLNFDYIVDFFYDEDGNVMHGEYKNYNETLISAPSCSIALQWLRDIYGVDIFIARMSNITMPNIGYSFVLYLPENHKPYISPEPYESYEVAELKALMHVIENYTIQSNG